MSELNVELLVQTFNEKIASLMSELVVKETMIKQLNLDMDKLMDAIRSLRINDDDGSSSDSKQGSAPLKAAKTRNQKPESLQ